MSEKPPKIKNLELEELNRREQELLERRKAILKRMAELKIIIEKPDEEIVVKKDPIPKFDLDLHQPNKYIHQRTTELIIAAEKLKKEPTPKVEVESPKKVEETIKHNEVLVEKVIKEAEAEVDDIIKTELDAFNNGMKVSTSQLIAKLNKDVLKGTGATLKGIEAGKVGAWWFKLTQKLWKNKIIRYMTLSGGLAAGIALQYHSPREYWAMLNNYKERHWTKKNKDDPKIVGVNEKYNDSTSIEKSTYDFLGEHKIDYKSGYYMTSVFDLSDRTPPRFKLINDRENYDKMDSAAGITTNMFKKFYDYGEFEPVMRGHVGENAEKKGDIPVIGYNKSTEQMRAGHYKDFNDDWMVSETYEIPLNFQLQGDSLKLMYHGQAERMVPVSINEKGKEIPFPIGVTYDNKITKMKPSDCVRFGTLEGGKVIMVCGDKQLQVNGSFADMFAVYSRLKKEYPGKPIQGFLLDNGSYNLPIWDKDNSLSKDEIWKHMWRNRDGGTALVLTNDGRISPYEYKNRYKEFDHYTPNFTLDSVTKKPAMNEKSVVVIHHTGNYGDPTAIVREFMDSTTDKSSHVLIMKDGTRHLFNNDNYVLAHAGKSDFNDRNKVNYFSLGIEIEGDSQNGEQFTLAQLESLIEYLHPRIEKYKIPLENITTHKIIRDNYMRKHPDDKKAQKKVDLDDGVWKQIQELIKKKLYNETKADTLTQKGKKALATISYQDAYREMKNKEQAMNHVESFLREQGFKEEDLEEVFKSLT